MVYSKGDQDGVIISPYLQLKAMECLYKTMKNKVELEKENLYLKKDKVNSNSHIHSLSMQEKDIFQNSVQPFKKQSKFSLISFIMQQ